MSWEDDYLDAAVAKEEVTLEEVEVGPMTLVNMGPLFGVRYIWYTKYSATLIVYHVRHHWLNEPERCQDGYVPETDWLCVWYQGAGLRDRPDDRRYEGDYVARDIQKTPLRGDGDLVPQVVEPSWDVFEWHCKPMTKDVPAKQRATARNAFVKLEEQASAAGTIPPRAGEVRGGGAGGSKTADVRGLPSLVETDSFLIGNRGSRFSLRVDDAESKPSRAVQGSKLGIGLHTLDLIGDLPSIERPWLRLLFNVVSPIEVRVTPVTDIDVTSGGTVELRVRNQSRSEHCMRVEVSSVPPGWTASSRKRYVVLGIGKEAVVPIHVQQAIAVSASREPVPVSVRLSLLAVRASDVFSTFYVRPRGRRRGKRGSDSRAPTLGVPISLARQLVARRPRRRSTLGPSGKAIAVSVAAPIRAEPLAPARMQQILELGTALLTGHASPPGREIS